MAVVLLGASLTGVVYGARTALAQTLYFTAKFGSVRENVPRILQHCQRAWTLYPSNYYAALWAAEKAYHAFAGAENGAQEAYWSAARLWCERGLRLNPHNSSLRLLQTRLLRRDSLEKATAYWAAYVDWNFWNPHHHAVLAELYAAGDRWGRAMRSLQWVKGSPYYEEARRKVNRAWREQQRPPPALPSDTR